MWVRTCYLTKFLAWVWSRQSFPCGATTLYKLLCSLQQISRLASTLKSHLVLCFLPKYGVLFSVSRLLSHAFNWFLNLHCLQAPLSTMVIHIKISDSITTILNNLYFSGDDLCCRCATWYSIESNRNQYMERTGTPVFKQRCSDMVSCERTLWIWWSILDRSVKFGHWNCANYDSMVSL